MGNCLVTKLKSVVDDNNLITLGELDIVLGSRGEITYFDVSGAEKVTLTGNGHFTDSSGTLDYGDTRTNVSSVYVIGYSEGDKLKITSKYNLTQLAVNDSINYIFKSNEILDIGYMPNLTRFNLGNGGAGCIVNLDDMYSIRIAYIRCPYADNIYGSMEKLVKKQLDLGRTDGYTTFSNYKGQHFTFKEKTMAQLYTEMSFDWCRITYSENGATITKGDGESGDTLAIYNKNTGWDYRF